MQTSHIADDMSVSFRNMVTNEGELKVYMQAFYPKSNLKGYECQQQFLTFVQADQVRALIFISDLVEAQVEGDEHGVYATAYDSLRASVSVFLDFDISGTLIP